jgi:hypothetical protein
MPTAIPCGFSWPARKARRRQRHRRHGAAGAARRTRRPRTIWCSCGCTATAIVSRLGQAAEPARREALDRVELRCYAKVHLARLAGLDPESTDLPAELESELADLAWLIADTFGPLSHLNLGQQTSPFDFGKLEKAKGLEKPDEVFEAIARLDHPDAESVLTMFGRHTTDKKTAKAPRRCPRPRPVPPAAGAPRSRWSG